MESSSDCNRLWIWSLNLELSTMQNYYQTMSSRKNLVSRRWISSSNKYFNKQIINYKTKQYLVNTINLSGFSINLVGKFLTFHYILYTLYIYIYIKVIATLRVLLPQSLLSGITLCCRRKAGMRVEAFQKPDLLQTMSQSC